MRAPSGYAIWSIKGVLRGFGPALCLQARPQIFHMRFGSCFPEPVDARMLSTWLSYGDFCRLVDVGLQSDYLHEIVYGVSDNPQSFWDNGNATRLGYKPLDTAEDYRQQVAGIISHNAVAEALQVGGFPADEFTFDLAKIL